MTVSLKQPTMMEKQNQCMLKLADRLKLKWNHFIKHVIHIFIV